MNKYRDDDTTDLATTQRVVKAGSTPPPSTTAASSVFDAGRKAKAAARPPAFDASAVVIQKNVPKPKSRFEKTSAYQSLVERMEPGDMVEMPLRQAKSLYARCKAFAKAEPSHPKFSIRTLNETTAGVWRDA